mgnify:CR=1 FL=1
MMQLSSNKFILPGNGDILVEWRRSRIIFGKIDYFIVYYKSALDKSYFKRKIDVSTTNTSDLYLVSHYYNDPALIY